MGKGSFGDSRFVEREEILGSSGGGPPLIDEPESSAGGDTVRVSHPGWRACSPLPQNENSPFKKIRKKVQKVGKSKNILFLTNFFNSPLRLSMAIDRGWLGRAASLWQPGPAIHIG